MKKIAVIGTIALFACAFASVSGAATTKGTRHSTKVHPCATCTGAHGTTPREPESGKPPEPANPFQLYKPALKMLGVEPVGNYAIRINWSDGHNSGIYSYEHLRLICQCEQCRALAQR